ncbi:MAG: hypothetical protein HWE27_09870 [Gammaproteobacteria bacterium]|nr:hypothetical protein [Gammaproteobacteria bacterium]
MAFLIIFVFTLIFFPSWSLELLGVGACVLSCLAILKAGSEQLTTGKRHPANDQIIKANLAEAIVD